MIEPLTGSNRKNQKMAKVLLKSGSGVRGSQASKYDAHHTVLSQTYGALADLRRELSDSKAAVSEREELLKNFAVCADSQRAWLLLEDYFEKLSLSRKDFPNPDWWPRLLSATGKSRLEELSFLFLRAKRSLPTELSCYANLDRFTQVEQAAQEQQLVRQLETWLFPPKLSDLELLHWLARWGHANRLEYMTEEGSRYLEFHGQLAELAPHLENGNAELAFTHRLRLPCGTTHTLDKVKFFSGRPPLALLRNV